jgi:hypothetical protein
VGSDRELKRALIGLVNASGACLNAPEALQVEKLASLPQERQKDGNAQGEKHHPTSGLLSR